MPPPIAVVGALENRESIVSRKLVLATFIGASCLVGQACAQSNPTSQSQDNNWSGNISLGFISTTGNTHKTTASGGVDLKHETTDWRDHFKLTGIYSRDSGSTTASRYQALAQRNINLDGKKHYLFTRASATKDRFSGYDYVLNASVGYGQRVWERAFSYSKKHAYLDLELGPGYRYARILPENVPPGGDNAERNATVRTGAVFSYPLSSSATFSQTLDGTFTVSGQHNVEAQSETALVAQIMDKLAVKISYQVNYTENPPDAKVSTDTETQVSLLYQI